MDNRCPLCGKDLGTRKLANSIVARMDVECPHCAGQLSMNVHRAETGLVLASVGGCVALAALAYALRSQSLLLAALACAMAAAAAVYFLERVWLRAWPRYLPRAPRRGME
jgi:DNA-directed RNA polymerase subunit RPC12/RpoP/uncharacterized membrane protein